MPGPRSRLLLATLTAFGGGLVAAPAASASQGGVLVAGFLGLPSLHSIIQGIANGFFGALAEALVPGFLKHGSVATIQHLVALPDPSSWPHVSALQGEMVYLAAMMLPVMLVVGTVRYWVLGLTGAAHPAGALGRCVWVTFVLVIYGWLVSQVVAAANTLTHAILGFPQVGDGLARIVGVLFGGALLAEADDVFGAFLVIIGVLFAAALFALQMLMTVVLAVLIVAGPPLIALSALPELSHLARGWAHGLLAVAMIPFAWTVLFATAGALCLDATSFTGGAGGLPGHIAAAFAGLITFVLAVKLPLMLLGQLRHLLTPAHGGAASQIAGQMPGAERIRTAHARLRSAALDGVPSLGRSVGRAAGALGAPAGGPVGAAGRRLGHLAGFAAGTQAATAGAGAVAAGAGAQFAERAAGASRKRGLAERLAKARGVLADAPAEARAAMANRKGTATPRPGQPRSGRVATGNTQRTSSTSAAGKSKPAPSTSVKAREATPARKAPANPPAPPAAKSPPTTTKGASPPADPRRTGSGPAGKGTAAGAPGVRDSARREAARRSASAPPPKPRQPKRPAAQPGTGSRPAGRVRRKPRPGSRG